MAPGKPILSIQELRASAGTKPALAAPLEIAGGDRVALIGRSGTGKSLFLRAIAGLDPVNAAEISLEGKPASAFPQPQWRARVSYLSPAPAFWGKALRQDFERAAALGIHAGQAPALEEAEKLLAKLDAPGLLSLDPATLSSGERQRATLARLLWLSPQILLLDEPTSAMDARTRHLAEEMLMHWCAFPEKHRAIFWITHDTAQARNFCNRYLLVEESKVLQITKEELP